MHRFFVPPDLIQDETASLPSEAARQAALVLRLKPGDQVVLLDNLGQEYLVRLESVSPRSAAGIVLEKSTCKNEPAVRVTLYQAITGREKFELILQKAAELGATGITPVITSRSLARGVDGGKHDRWQRILQEAAEQCGRGCIPVLGHPLLLKDALVSASRLGDPCLFAWEQEASLSIQQALKAAHSHQNVSIFIGPEGGFTEEEASQARTAGASVVTLGRRILRSETAAITSLILVMHTLGELG